jgi:hypothetical protein
MTLARVVLIAIGLATGGYGALLLLTDNPWPIIINIGVWAAAGVILHDFVFAPACVAIGLTGRRLLPRQFHSPVATAALCTVVLMLLAIPVYSRPGARPDNPTVLDRNYPAGLWIAVSVVWAAAMVFLVAQRVFKRRKGTASEPLNDEPVATVDGADRRDGGDA